MKTSRAAITLRQYLADRKVGQARFAFTELNATDTTLQSWLAGRATPSLSNALKIEAVTGIPAADWLVDGEQADGH